MNSRKKIGAIAAVGAVLLTYGMAAGSSAADNGSPSPLTLTPTATTSTAPVVPLSGVLGSQQSDVNSDDSAIGPDADDDSSPSAGTLNSDNANDNGDNANGDNADDNGDNADDNGDNANGDNADDNGDNANGDNADDNGDN